MLKKVMSSVAKKEQIVIAGAGLAGALQGVFFAKQGFDVHIYERRGDMRKEDMSAGRSINLALSTRGMNALQRVGILDEVMSIAIPMYARAIHNLDGSLVHSNYGKEGKKHINSVSRGELNCKLLDAAEAAGAKIHFRHKCNGVNLKEKTVRFTSLEDSNKVVNAQPNLVVGADGAFSAIRASLQRTDRFNYSQSFLEHGYKELCIPPTADGGHAIDKNRLHIWPRGELMMIALPNIDGSFTCTLFAPFTTFDQLKTREDVDKYFRAQFADAVPLMPTLLDDFFANPTPSLVTIRCRPYSRENFATLLGDAAHAVVPFFGQGMNAAFEDCVALADCVEAARAASAEHDWRAAALHAYEEARIDNSHAIADMALENYVEMRDLTADPEFLFRKDVGHLLGKKFPDRFLTRYEYVSFSLVPYTEAVRIGKLNDVVLDALIAKLDGSRDINKIDLALAKELCEKHLPLVQQDKLATLTERGENE